MVTHYGPYDYVFISAMKHARSEEDPFTLMRLIQTNIFNIVNVLKQVKGSGLKKYFCVSTDKAANPVNMMGASKRIMEQFLVGESYKIHFDGQVCKCCVFDGSLHGFNQRFAKQPISAPHDVRRYFVTPQGLENFVCCLVCWGRMRDIFS